MSLIKINHPFSVNDDEPKKKKKSVSKKLITLDGVKLASSLQVHQSAHLITPEPSLLIFPPQLMPSPRSSEQRLDTAITNSSPSAR